MEYKPGDAAALIGAVNGRIERVVGIVAPECVATNGSDLLVIVGDGLDPSTEDSQVVYALFKFLSENTDRAAIVDATTKLLICARIVAPLGLAVALVFVRVAAVLLG